VAVSLSIANHHASLPIAWRLYLPEDWSNDAERRKKAGVPADVTFKTKPQIALEQITRACEAGIAHGVVLMDAGYGADTGLGDSITALGLSYAAGIGPNTSAWAPGVAPKVRASSATPLPPKPWSGQGRPATRLRRDAEHRPVAVKALALSLPEDAWQTITWREGVDDALTSRCARVRVRPAHRDYNLAEPRPEEWLLIEWPEGDH
jgi:SRSO17 transposase